MIDTLALPSLTSLDLLLLYALMSRWCGAGDSDPNLPVHISSIRIGKCEKQRLPNHLKVLLEPSSLFEICGCNGGRCWSIDAGSGSSA
jgi:hypothetical protein